MAKKKKTAGKVLYPGVILRGDKLLVQPTKSKVPIQKTGRITLPYNVRDKITEYENVIKKD
jgi:hypothetical protein